MSNDELISSIMSDINNYTGKDPLLPWLRGIRKMKENFTPQALKENLPGLLQKCAQTFQLDRRYRNDMRYLRIWLNLMDFVDDPKELLRTMEANHIGTKRCQFYQAYALYYEKSKKYDEAEKMYHLGVKNLAEPQDELQKSYDQFLQRMERRNNKRNKELKVSKRPLATKTERTNGASSIDELGSKDVKTKRDDTVVIKFVDTAIVGKSEAENACHHGLVDPTINMKEAMNEINSMFRAPLETGPLPKKSHRNHSKEDLSKQKGFEVFVDEIMDDGIKPSGSSTEARQSHQEPLQIFIDDEGCSEASDVNVNMHEDSTSEPKLNGFVFPHPKDSEKSSDMEYEGSSRVLKFREDTVVCRFVGSAILDEPEVENVCHHGLVDPTINMKEAMNDINNMFGKPMDFVRKRRSVKQEKAQEINSGKELGGFSILADDELEQGLPEPAPVAPTPPLPKLQRKSEEPDLFEQTMLTKEAMDDINEMFRMPLDF